MSARSVLSFAVLSGLMSCNDTSVQSGHGTTAAGSVAHVVDGRLTVHIVEAEGGG